MQDLRDILKTYGIGLTGGIGTGKTTMAQLIAAAGLPVIDADQLARKVTAPNSVGTLAVAKHFGPGALHEDGTLNRRFLAQLVFKDQAARQSLERILHPLIRAELLAVLTALGIAQAPRFFVYEASLIFERSSEKDFRAVWATYCPIDVQIARIMARDGRSREEANDMIQSQLDPALKAARADAVFDTTKSPTELSAELRGLLAEMLTSPSPEVSGT